MIINNGLLTGVQSCTSCNKLDFSTSQHQYINIVFFPFEILKIKTEAWY